MLPPDDLQTTFSVIQPLSKAFPKVLNVPPGLCLQAQKLLLAEVLDISRRSGSSIAVACTMCEMRMASVPSLRRQHPALESLQSAVHPQECLGLHSQLLLHVLLPLQKQGHGPVELERLPRRDARKVLGVSRCRIITCPGGRTVGQCWWRNRLRLATAAFTTTPQRYSKPHLRLRLLQLRAQEGEAFFGLCQESCNRRTSDAHFEMSQLQALALA
mmetsp:Transcript_125466/g.349196  ORF Transcript_125466/g.349196 Transcript_125466/m.349196 type:complete len:215 (+) Transcript_125466:1626-2270(+)